MAQKELDSIIRDRDKLLKDLLDSLYFSNNMEPYASEYSAIKKRLKSDCPKIYWKSEKHEKARSELEKKLHQNKEEFKRANFDSELKKPLEFVDAYCRWNPKTPQENALKSELEKEVKNFVESYKELTDSISSARR